MIILVVDDIETNRKLLRALLEAEGHTTIEACDGVEALHILLRETIDAVVSDILMPNMDGYRLCSEVRSDPRLKRMPFIVYTSTYTSPEDQKLAINVGADCYLTKPRPVSAILEAIDEIRSRSNQSERKPLDNNAHLSLMKEYNEVLVKKLEEKNVSLDRASKKLVEANVNLEARVNQRTSELFAMTQVLQREVEQRKRAQEDSEHLLIELRLSMAQVKTLSGLLPVCAWCKKVRNDEGYWYQLEKYLIAHSDVTFTHSICENCAPGFRNSGAKR